jgi:hypothetical protein
MDGFPVEVSTTGSINDLPRLVARLREVGAQPAHNGAVSAQNAPGAPHATGVPQGKGARPLVKEFSPDGRPICPVHGKPMRESQHKPNEWFCSSKGGEFTNDKGYCAVTHTE